ncbi:MAG: sigma-70 family RNA polymerase sigma factor [Opitutaceae bacterium]|jgi:RNA polymerase sigma-70 factor (ECF subfamily)|nr:sigma-70 family RNA polymerase sigma factor [Opitutaceae bacterium]
MNQEPIHENKDDAGDFVPSAVAEYQGALARYAARLLGGDADRARDVVQDTFVRLMAQPREVVDGHLAEWLFTVCRHRALDVLRKEGRMKRFDEGRDGRVTAGDPQPGRALEQAETRAALLRLIDGLPANEQEVIRLKFQNDFSYKEISRITELSVNHVGVLIHNAVKRLRADFAAQQS